jgi:AhpD family alkylhydroperoxidase
VMVGILTHTKGAVDHGMRSATAKEAAFWNI